MSYVSNNIGIIGELMNLPDPYTRVLRYLEERERRRNDPLTVSFHDTDIYVLCDADITVYNDVRERLLMEINDVFCPSDVSSDIYKKGSLLSNRELEYRKEEHRKSIVREKRRGRL
ncbi:MAG: hypothetical protein QW393_04935 [Candidatus Micrarchaeaceae archaeon]